MISASSRRPGLSRPVRALALAALAAAGLPATALATHAGHGEVAAPRVEEVGILDPSLASYGDWVEVPRHGKAWHPCQVGDDWRPYLHGSWTWTEAGWFWVSDEPWGETTYHYGRWLFTGQYGWVWVPGRTWAPAWVAWRWNDDVAGWAPLPPTGEPLSSFWTFVPVAKLATDRADAAALPAARDPPSRRF